MFASKQSKQFSGPLGLRWPTLALAALLVAACHRPREAESVSKQAEEPPRPPTELEKGVAASSRKTEAWLERFGQSRTRLDFEAKPRVDCAARELELELALLQSKAVLEGDSTSRIELTRSTTALATCEKGATSDTAVNGRATETSLLLGVGRVLEAEKRFEDERRWLMKQHGPKSSAEAKLVENWIQSLIFAGLLGPAYATFEEAKPLLLHERGPETTQLLLRLAQFACLHGRSSLAARYAEDARRQWGSRDLDMGAAIALASTADCLSLHGEPSAGSRLGNAALQAQLAHARRSSGPAEEHMRRVMVGQVQVALGRTEAEQTFEELLQEIGPQAPELSDPNYSAFVLALSELARLQAQTGRLAVARETLESFPDSALDVLGPSLDRALGRGAAAEKAWHALEQKSQGYAEPFRVLWATEGARIAWANQDRETSLDRFKRALKLAEDHAKARAQQGSEEDRRRAYEPIRPVVSALVAAQLKSWRSDETYLRAALDAILLLQSGVLEGTIEDMELLRARDPALLRRLKAARDALAKKSVGAGAGSADQLYRERLDLERLEAAARQSTRQFRTSRPRLTSLEAQKRLRAGEVLLTYFEFQAEAPDLLPEQAERHIAVYGLATDGPPFAHDLGPAKEIETRVEAFRRALVPGSGGFREAGRALGELVLTPVTKKLHGATALQVTAAGALHLVPLAALLDEKDQPYLERYSIHYVGSVRELEPSSPAAAKASTQRTPFIVAGPNFGGTSSAEASPFSLASRGVRSAALESIEWQALPGAAREGNAILKLFPGATLIEGARATEASVKALSSPEILHIATHGYFLPEGSSQKAGLPQWVEDPLLYSGLVFSGANSGGMGGEDGYLTALELASIDLSRTQLTTLSACETGLGYVGGEGVHGLRRALHMAGSKSQLLSLWNVDDEATLELMMAFYERLQAGEGRAEALRNVQRAMFAGKSPAPPSSKRPRSSQVGKYRAPYFWAAFVLSGEDGPLSAHSP